MKRIAAVALPLLLLAIVAGCTGETKEKTSTKTDPKTSSTTEKKTDTSNATQVVLSVPGIK